ncbi:MAG: hypothetical protein SPE13_01790 [Alloprevotella sp.]|nr:hypothetical protein [Bacteroidales bacterium]MDY4564153.1 hypothetical protein [Alloprevotella sp.]MDY4621086.1 hypothetical protein [Alloprevotella sp.]
MKKLVSLLFVFLFSQFSFAQALGDFMILDGVPCFVFYVDESGEHGMVMSFSAISAKKAKKVQKEMEKLLAEEGGTQSDANNIQWSKLVEPDKFIWKADNKKDLEELVAKFSTSGEHNLQVIKAYCQEHGKDLSNFSDHYWASQLGEGWFIPGDDELTKFAEFFCGGVGKENGLGISKWLGRSKHVTTNPLVKKQLYILCQNSILSSSVRFSDCRRGLVCEQSTMFKSHCFFTFYDKWSRFEFQCAVKRF